jgi:hypothetical protein
MDNFIQFRLTNAGKAAMLSANDGSVGFSVAQARFSTAALNMSSLANTTALNSVVVTQNVAQGLSYHNENILQIAIQIVPNDQYDIKSIGLYTEKGVLIAVASIGSGLLFRFYEDVPFVLIAVIILLDESVTSYTARINPNASILSVLLKNHIDSPNPHRGFVYKTEFDNYKDQVDQFLDEILHIGVWIGTDDEDFNPADTIYSLLGIRSVWRLRPRAPYGVLNAADEIGIMRNYNGNGIAHKNNTTRLWQRMESDYRDPTVVMRAFMQSFGETDNLRDLNPRIDPSTMDVKEGQAVTFTITAEDLIGEVLEWRITGNIERTDISPSQLKGYLVIGGDATASYTVAAVLDQLDEGTEQLTFSIPKMPGLSVTVNLHDQENTTYQTTGFVAVGKENNTIQYDYLPKAHQLIDSNGADSRYMVNANIDLGFMLSAYYVNAYYLQPEFWFRLVIGQEHQTDLYRVYDQIDKRNRKFFIPMGDDQILVDIGAILKEFGFSQDGKLQFGTDNSIDVMFGFCHDDYFQSESNSIMTVPLGHGRMTLNLQG